MVFGLTGSRSKSKSTNEGVFSQYSSPNLPDWYIGRQKGINEDLGHISGRWGMGQLDPNQQAGINTLTNLSATNPGATYLRDVTNPALQGLGGQFQALANQPAHQLSGPTPTVTAPLIAGPQTITTRDVAADQIAAESAFENAGQYRDAYGTGVLDPALADYDAGVGRSANAFRAASIGGGGQAGGTQPVAAGVLAGEAARGRGALSASIRSDILDKSFGFGGQDAGRKLQAAATNQSANLQAGLSNEARRLSADTSNAGNRIAVDSANAGNQLTASGQNAQIMNTRDLANLQARIAGDATTMGALNALGDVIQTQGANAITADNQVAQNAIAALEAAGIPLNQALLVINAQIGAQDSALPSFGTTTTGNERSVGAATNTRFGFSYDR